MHTDKLWDDTAAPSRASQRTAMHAYKNAKLYVSVQPSHVEVQSSLAYNQVVFCSRVLSTVMTEPSSPWTGCFLRRIAERKHYLAYSIKPGTGMRDCIHNTYSRRVKLPTPAR